MSGIRIPDTPIAVDFWEIQQCFGVHLFFLSHAHSDHTSGLSSSWAHRLYTSPLTKKIILNELKVRDEFVHELELNRVHVIPLDDVGRETMNVVLIDANHCPGAVMFLFEGYFGRILYTGDFRYSPVMFSHSVLRRLPSLDVLYLDDTYIHRPNNFLIREEYVKEIIGIIERHPAHHIYIGKGTLGKEALLVRLATHFDTVVSVSEDMFKLIALLDLPSVFTREQNKGFIHTLPIKSLLLKKVRDRIIGEREGQAIFIEPSALHTLKTKKCGDLWRVPYSDHSSFAELHKFVSHLKPRCVRPIVHTTISMSVFDYSLDNSPSTVFDVPPSVSTMIHHDSRCTSPVTSLRQMLEERRQRIETTRSNSRRSKTARGIVYHLPKTSSEDNMQVDSSHQLNPAAEGCEGETGACTSSSADVDVGVPSSLQVPAHCESVVNSTYMSQVANLSTIQASSSQHNDSRNSLFVPSNQLGIHHVHSLSDLSGQYLINSANHQISRSLFSIQGQPIAAYSLSSPDVTVPAENVPLQVQQPESSGCTIETATSENGDIGLHITNVISVQPAVETKPSECSQKSAPPQSPAVHMPIGSINFQDGPHSASMPDTSQQYCQVPPDALSAIMICPSPSVSATAGDISQIRTENGGIKSEVTLEGYQKKKVKKNGKNCKRIGKNCKTLLHKSGELSKRVRATAAPSPRAHSQKDRSSLTDNEVCNQTNPSRNNPKSTRQPYPSRMIKRKRCSYDAAFKLQAVEAAEKTNNYKAGKKFDVNEKQIREWRKQKSQLQLLPRTNKAKRGPKTGAIPSMECELLAWIQDQRQSAITVSRAQIRLKAESLSRTMASNPSFKASMGWCFRFIRRHGLSVRRQTKMAQQPCEASDAMTPHIKCPSSVPNMSSENKGTICSKSAPLQHPGTTLAEELASSPQHHASSKSNSDKIRSPPSNASPNISEQNCSSDYKLVDVPILSMHNNDIAAPFSKDQSQKDQTRTQLTQNDASPHQNANFSPASEQFNKHAGSKPDCSSPTGDKVCNQGYPSRNNVDSTPSGQLSTSSTCQLDSFRMYKRKRCSYDAAFKLQAVEAAEETNNVKAAEKFNVNERQIREWRKQKSELQSLPKTNKAKRGPKTGAIPSMEHELLAWIEDQRQSALMVSRAQILFKAKSLSRTMAGNPSFKASAGWYLGFMRRNGLSTRCKKFKKSLPALNQSSQQPCEDSLMPHIKCPSSVLNTSSEIGRVCSKSAPLQHSGTTLAEELASSPQHHASSKSHSGQLRSPPSNASTNISEQNSSRDVPILPTHDNDTAAPFRKDQSQKDQTRTQNDASLCHNVNFSPASEQSSKQAGSKPACSSHTDNGVCYQTSPSRNNVDSTLSGQSSTNSTCQLDSSRMSKKKRCSYDAAFKLQAVEAAEETNNVKAAEKFNVNTKQIREWRKKKSELQSLPKTNKAKRGPKTGASPSMERELLAWIEDQRRSALTVSRVQILSKAKSLSRTMAGNSVFKASAGWYIRFMRRHGLSIRRKTKIAQKLPDDPEEKLNGTENDFVWEDGERPDDEEDDGEDNIYDERLAEEDIIYSDDEHDGFMGFDPANFV